MYKVLKYQSDVIVATVTFAQQTNSTHTAQSYELTFAKAS